MRSHILNSTQPLLVAGLSALLGLALSGCASAPSAGEALGESEQAATACVTIQRGEGAGAVSDAFLHEGDPASVYGGPDMYAGIHSSGATQYAVLQFDLSAIPAGAAIASADVTLSIGSSNADVVNAHRITAAWTESDATWNLLSTAWDPEVAGSFTAGIYGNRTFSVTSLVQSWVDGTVENHGVLLEQGAHRTQLKTSEASQANRPALVVCYEAGDTGATTGAGGAGGDETSSASSTTSTSSASSGGEGGSGGAGGEGGAGGAGEVIGTISGTPGPAISCDAEAPGAGHNCGAGHDDDCCASLPVTGGTFNRLNDAAYPATVSSFYLDKYNVTVGRFRQFIEQTGGPTQANPPVAGAGAHPKIADSGWDPAWNSMLAADTAALKSALVCDPYGWADWSDDAGDKENKPIVCATWTELFAFCAWDGGRLPTQAEMNYAAAGGDEQRLYPWVAASVSDISTSDASWCCQGDGSVAGECINGYPSSSEYPCHPNDLTDVGSFPAGAGRWGQLDLAGNAYKATRDGSDNYTPLTPCNDCSRLDNSSVGRVMHGGSFLAAAYKQTTTYRAGYATDARRYYITASCARDL